MLAAQASNAPNVGLTSAQYSDSTSSFNFDITNAYYGFDSNFETVEFQAGNNNSSLQLSDNGSASSIFSYDAATNQVTYSGFYEDAAFNWISFSYTGSNFTIDLTEIAPNGLAGFVGTTSLNTAYTVDTLQINVSAVPVPAAVWLFGSGIIGLLGIARRRR